MATVSRIITTFKRSAGYGAVFLGLACDGRPDGPLSPAPPSVAGRSMAANVDLGAALRDRASGYADIHGTTVQGIKDETYTFTAVSRGTAPSATGKVEVRALRFTNVKRSASADVTCLSIVGNVAWVGSVVRRMIVDGEEDVAFAGRPMIFRVQDVGEGTSNDFASLVFFPGAGGDLTHCNTRPAFPILRESSNGIIQVQPN